MNLVVMQEVGGRLAKRMESGLGTSSLSAGNRLSDFTLRMLPVESIDCAMPDVEIRYLASWSPAKYVSELTPP
jgi:hypothetical protein